MTKFNLNHIGQVIDFQFGKFNQKLVVLGIEKDYWGRTRYFVENPFYAKGESPFMQISTNSSMIKSLLPSVALSHRQWLLVAALHASYMSNLYRRLAHRHSNDYYLVTEQRTTLNGDKLLNTAIEDDNCDTEKQARRILKAKKAYKLYCELITMWKESQSQEADEPFQAAMYPNYKATRTLDSSNAEF